MTSMTATPDWTLARPRPATSGNSLSLPASIDGRLNRIVCGAIGLLLPFTILTAQVLPVSGIAPVDLACAAFLGILLFRHRLRRVPDAAGVYLAAILLSLIPALMVTPGARVDAWAGFGTMLVAFGFYVAGLNLGRYPELMRPLLLGLSVGIFAQVVLAGLRVSQSFGWAFCAAGLLLTFGTRLGTPVLRGIYVAAGLAAVVFAFLGSGSAGTLAVLAWALFACLVGWRSAKRTSYLVVLGTIAAVAILVAVSWPSLSSYVSGQRILGTAETLGADGLIQNQVESVGSATRGFPFGLGAGHGHDGIAGVAVEFGMLGLAGFAGMIALPLILGRRRLTSKDAWKVVLLLASFLPACFVFMFQNALYRDRAFLLFLGVATGFVLGRLRTRPAAAPDRRAAPVPAPSPAADRDLVYREIRA